MSNIRVGKYILPLVSDGKYPKTVRLGNTNFYVFDGLIQRGTIERAEDVSRFLSMWANDSAYWYRGIANCHWQLPQILSYKPIKSEGDNPAPNFTMGEGSNTAWLPGEINFSVCVTAALSCRFMMLEQKFFKEQGVAPVGVIMCLQLGKTINRDIDICLMPGSEIQVKGPLDSRNLTYINLLANLNDTGPLFYLHKANSLLEVQPSREFIQKNDMKSALLESSISKCMPWVSTAKCWMEGVCGSGLEPYDYSANPSFVTDITGVVADDEYIRVDKPIVDSSNLWMNDKDAQKCQDCDSIFTFFKRRHHCRGCGQIFCSDCLTKSKLKYDAKYLCKLCAMQIPSQYLA